MPLVLQKGLFHCCNNDIIVYGSTICYYLYPAHTLIRMPFIINSILYTNSLLALLLFQCERLCFILVKFISERLNCIRCIKNEDDKFYDEYYNKIFKPSKEYAGCSCFKSVGPLLTYYIQPLLTCGVLIILVMFIWVLSDLFRLHQDHFTDKNQVEALILLVPTLLLLFGSWLKLDVFFDIEEPKSKRELLHEILEEMKRQSNTEMESMPTQAPANMNQDAIDVPNERTRLLHSNPNCPMNT